MWYPHAHTLQCMSAELSLGHSTTTYELNAIIQYSWFLGDQSYMNLAEVHTVHEWSPYLNTVPRPFSPHHLNLTESSFAGGSTECVHTILGMLKCRKPCVIPVTFGGKVVQTCASTEEISQPIYITPSAAGIERTIITFAFKIFHQACFFRHFCISPTEPAIVHHSSDVEWGGSHGNQIGLIPHPLAADNE